MSVRTIRRAAILWESLTGYVQAALRAVSASGVELLIVQRSRETNASYELALGEHCELIDLSQDASIDVAERVRKFQPDLVLMTANGDPGYLATAAAERAAGTVVVWASDMAPREWWRDGYSALRGRLGALSDFDAAFVPGIAGAAYAERVGFARERIFTGLYTCDSALFRPVGMARHTDKHAPWPRVFLFLGQFIHRKGVDTLVNAYARYRQGSAAPWQLWCVGAGPMRPLLDGQDGITAMDFAPPVECAKLMAQAGALVLPSRVDHWGVVIHEAACAGLPVIATDTSFASRDLIEDDASGFTFTAGDAARLSTLFSACERDGEARRLGRRSMELSSRFDPAIFANVLTHDIPQAAAR